MSQFCIVELAQTSIYFESFPRKSSRHVLSACDLTHTPCATPPPAVQRVLLRAEGDAWSCPACLPGCLLRCGGSGAGTAAHRPPASSHRYSWMASPGVGLHLIRKRGVVRSAVVERRNLLTVCRWEFLTLISLCTTGRMKQRLQLDFWRQIYLVIISRRKHFSQATALKGAALQPSHPGIKLLNIRLHRCRHESHSV